MMKKRCLCLVFAALLLLSLTGKRARPPRALGVPGDQTMR